MKKIYSLFIGFAFVGLHAQTTYLSDNFDYPEGEELVNHGWYAHSAAATNSILVHTVGLSWAGYQASGIGKSALVNNTGEDINKPTSGDLTTGAAYCSFLLNVNQALAISSPGFFLHFGSYTGGTPSAAYDNISTAFRARTFVAPGTDPATQFKLGISFNATATSGETADLNVGETYLVVVKYQFVDGADNDEVSLFVFEQGANIADEPATPDLGPFLGTAPDAASIQAICLRQFAEGQNVVIDGIMVKDAWDIEECTPVQGVDEQTSCAAFTWIDGNTYQSSNNTATFTIVGGASNGCDSIVTLDLTIVEVDLEVNQTDNVLNSTAQNATFQWVDCDNGFEIIAGEEGSTFEASVSGNYAVIVTQNSCSDTSECFNVVVANIDDQENTALVSVFPNPSKGIFTVEILQSDIQKIEIVNSIGQVITTYNKPVQNQKIAMNLNRGLYFVLTTNQKGERSAQKVVVQ